MAVDDDSARQLSHPVAQSTNGNSVTIPSEEDGCAPGVEASEHSQADPQVAEARTDDSLDAETDAGIGVESKRRSALAAVSSPAGPASIVGLVTVLALTGLGGWLGVRAYHLHQDDKQRNLFLQVGRQGALNLTTIDYQHVDADIQRILSSATGPFYDDFSKRVQPFVDVVKKAQSKSVGTVTEAGLESETGNDAQILVAVAVKTSNAGAPEQNPRAWRMRIAVTKIGAEAKVSNVEFVP